MRGASVVFCPDGGAPAKSQEEARERLESDYVSDEKVTWEVRDPSETEMDDLYGIVADGDTEATLEDGLGFVGPGYIRQYLGVVPRGRNAPKGFYSVACMWPEQGPAGVEDACALIAESFEVI